MFDTQLTKLASWTYQTAEKICETMPETDSRKTRNKLWNNKWQSITKNLKWIVRRMKQTKGKQDCQISQYSLEGRLSVTRRELFGSAFKLLWKHKTEIYFRVVHWRNKVASRWQSWVMKHVSHLQYQFQATFGKKWVHINKKSPIESPQGD